MINRFWWIVCKRCREETRGGNSKASLCGESNLAKSLFIFSAILMCIRGLVPSYSSWVPSVDLSWFGSCWARRDSPRGLGLIPQLCSCSSCPRYKKSLSWISSVNPSEIKATPQLSHLHPPETHREVQSSGTLLQNPVGVFNSKAASSKHLLQCFILCIASDLMECFSVPGSLEFLTCWNSSPVRR